MVLSLPRLALLSTEISDFSHRVMMSDGSTGDRVECTFHCHQSTVSARKILEDGV